MATVGSLQQYGYDPASYNKALIESRRNFVQQLQEGMAGIASGLSSAIGETVKAKKADAKVLAQANELKDKAVNALNIAEKISQNKEGKSIFKALGVANAQEAVDKRIGKITGELSAEELKAKADDLNRFVSSIASQIMRQYGVDGETAFQLIETGSDPTVIGEQFEKTRERQQVAQVGEFMRTRDPQTATQTGVLFGGPNVPVEIYKKAGIDYIPKQEDPLTGLQAQKLRAEIGKLERESAEQKEPPVSPQVEYGRKLKIEADTNLEQAKWRKRAYDNLYQQALKPKDANSIMTAILKSELSDREHTYLQTILNTGGVEGFKDYVLKQVEFAERDVRDAEKAAREADIKYKAHLKSAAGRGDVTAKTEIITDRQIRLDEAQEVFDSFYPKGKEQYWGDPEWQVKILVSSGVDEDIAREVVNKNNGIVTTGDSAAYTGSAAVGGLSAEDQAIAKWLDENGKLVTPETIEFVKKQMQKPQMPGR